MNHKDQQLKAIEYYIRKLFLDDPTGHDYYHMKRVARIAKQIAEREQADSFICEVAAWLHDVGDHKLFSNPQLVVAELEQFLQKNGFTSIEIERIHAAIQDVSFSKGKVPATIEGRIVQDSDRIDALGAIGIARTFAYGGAKGQLIYHDKETTGTSVQHFYDKLLHLKGLLNTESAKQIAEDRHEFLEHFIEKFHEEW